MHKIEEIWVNENINRCEYMESEIEIQQITSEPVTSTNIYCEQRYTNKDGYRFAIARHPFGQPTEIWVCDLRSFKICKAVVGDPLGSIYQKNALYYLTEKDDTTRLMCLNIDDMETEEVFDFNKEKPSIKNIIRKGAVTPDQRYFIGAPYHVRDNIYSIKRFDLHTGKVEQICEIEDFINPHLQFGAHPRKLLIQINPGGEIGSISGERLPRSGPNGSTLAICDVETGELTRLPIGEPHTALISGHLSWVGDKEEIFFSTVNNLNRDDSSPYVKREIIDGKEVKTAITLYTMDLAEKVARPIYYDVAFNHVSVSSNGKYFIADGHKVRSIFIGRFDTGNIVKFCDANTRQGGPQSTHVHPYMTPDEKFIIFVSNVTGCSQVYAAKVPEGFLEKI